MIVRTALAAVVLVASAGSALAQPAAPDGDIAHGKALFMRDGCFECHGTVGQGGPGIRLAPGPLPTPVIAAYIRNPAGEMPPYTSKVLSDKDIADIHAYLASIPKPPALADIPELH